MKLFELDDKWNLYVSEQAWGLSPFKALLKRDKTKSKIKATKEMEFIWHYSDIKSDYNNILNDEDRIAEIIKDVELPDGWKIDKEVQAAIDFYKERSVTTAGKLLDDSKMIANSLINIMKDLLSSEDGAEIKISDLNKVATTIKQMPDVIAALDKTEKAVLKELAENKTHIGSQEKNMFEDGFGIK